jgi:hypothetical protein
MQKCKARKIFSCSLLPNCKPCPCRQLSPIVILQLQNTTKDSSVRSISSSGFGDCAAPCRHLTGCKTENNAAPSVIDEAAIR